MPRSEPHKNPTEIAMLMALIVCVVSSSQIVHEFGSRFLDAAFVSGTAVNMRAFSCAAHALGIALGFGYAICKHDHLGRIRTKKWAMGFFSAQTLLVAIFYAAFSAQWLLATVALQAAIAAVSAFFIAGIVHYCAAIEHRESFAFIALCVIVPPFVVQGLFGAIETAPLAIVAITHMALLGCGLASSLTFSRRQDSSDSLTQLSAPFSMQLIIANGPDASRPKAIPPWMLIWIIVFMYGAVFGFLHVIPLGLPMPIFFGVNSAPFIRMASILLGAGIAAALFSSTFGDKPVDTTAIWNRFYRLVFPLVVLASLLIPFTQEQGYLLSITCSETALFYFDMILATGCIVVCKTLHADASIVFAHAFFARCAGFLLGDVLAGLMHETPLLTGSLLSLVGIAVFLALFLVTFNANGDRYAKTVWGILPKEDPKSRYDRQLHERCAQLASEFQLTEREAQTLELLAQNKRPKEISTELVLSIATIRTYVQGIYTKLDVHSHDELMKELHG